MRPTRAVGLASVVLAFGAGCTWLITFDEVEAVPAAVDGGDAADAREEASTDAADGGAPSDASIGDARRDVDLGTLTSCTAMANGLYCGNNQIKNYPGDSDDLVTCDGGKVVQVTFCARGSGCVRMANPRPDQCDQCWQKANGFYCGRDMPGWSRENANVRVQCQAGGFVDLAVCATACVSNGSASTCQ